jgi:protein-S-isoprenylcysteine O-methyltransferase Ste14
MTVSSPKGVSSGSGKTMGFDWRLMLGESLALFAGLALALFVPGAAWTWPAGWVYLGLFLAWYAGIEIWLARHSPGLLQERMRFRAPDEKGWDKLLFPVLALFPIPWLVLISLDATRFHWSLVPLAWRVVGVLTMMAGFYVIFAAFRENAFASPVVRIQADRGQTVISTGPYRYVRHPLYAGIVLFAIGSPLWLGSWYGVGSGIIMVLLVARRAVLEERTLRSELSGYAGYAKRVRYRFIPGVW